MRLNVRLELESLDGRWMPSATPTGTVPSADEVIESPLPDSALMDDPEFLAQLEKFNKALDELKAICREYAKREAAYILGERELKGLQDELDRRIAAGEPQGDLPLDIAVKGALLRALKILSTAEAAKYATKEVEVRAELAALNALIPPGVNTIAPGAIISADIIPALDAYLIIELIDQENPPPTLPPGVG